MPERFKLMPLTVLPTSDAAVVESFQEVSRFRPDAIPILDGDGAGDGYLASLSAGTPVPAQIIRYGQDAAVECLSAWILEPALSSPSTAVASLIGASGGSVKGLQDALIRKKKDRELRENIVWESLESSDCCERACEFFHDLAAIASGDNPSNPGWTSSQATNGTVVHVASHIKRARP